VRSRLSLSHALVKQPGNRQTARQSSNSQAIVKQRNLCVWRNFSGVPAESDSTRNVDLGFPVSTSFQILFKNISLLVLKVYNRLIRSRLPPDNQISYASLCSIQIPETDCANVCISCFWQTIKIVATSDDMRSDRVDVQQPILRIMSSDTTDTRRSADTFDRTWYGIIGLKGCNCALCHRIRQTPGVAQTFLIGHGMV
jgi:hypothetical protein